jgi:hypothetical protein
MKWVLVVLIGGLTPVTTDVTFEKLSDCLAAGDQLRQAYVDAFDSRTQPSANSPDRSERHRRRDYRRARELEATKFANSSTCVPHAGSDQPITSLNHPEQPKATPQTPTPAPSP